MSSKTLSNKTRKHDDPMLMRLLLGELRPEDARRLERRLEDDAELRGRSERLRAAWDALELPPAPPAPEGFRGGVVEAARRLAKSPPLDPPEGTKFPPLDPPEGTKAELSWSAAPVWARTGAAAALVLGMVLGLGGGRLSPVPGGEAVAVVEDTELDAYLAAELESGPLSLAEAYWLELEEGGEALLGEPLLDETLLDETLLDEEADGETPYGETPFGETPFGETPFGETPFGETL